MSIAVEAPSALAVQDLHVTYSGLGGEPVTALRGISLAVGRGEFVAVMGPSGSGKSTLLMAIAGLERVTSGRVLVGASDVAGLREPALTRWRRRHLGMVFQAHNLLPSMTARENVELPLRWAHRRVQRGLADDLLERLGVGQRAGHLPAQMSGGQQQRVAIARALAAAPDVVVADEPTGALDRHAATGVMEQLRTLVDVEGRTVVLVTHDPVAAAYADRLVVLVDGLVVDDLAMDPGRPGESAERAAAVLARVSGGR